MTITKKVYVLSASAGGYRVLFTAAQSIYRTFGIECRVSSLTKVPSLSGVYFPDLLRLLVLTQEPYEVCQEKVLIVNVRRLEHRKEEVFFSRLFKETAFILGRSIGLEACDKPDCLMFQTEKLPDLDRKGIRLCDVCAIEKDKLLRSLIS